ncbi:metalloregulator ArsR/SmtB family transcription factor [Rhizobium sp. LC145]|uniref:ArsR/SmtB family transcription factor n=1 Tax=Rhizobium sp. LC145 TaxID=1120688 RepID=UPI00062A3A27|nr:metalloregulator ArsR/SmtB family transcription factor [Rhizobium sp. LC145]KKX29342.1 ArsR family transcriptional regulator [Rhizobium sp. LC145]MDX3927865.1 metalloregulator ArsR/SmtB family transcription factor [Shinella sp.]TKT68954.1 helix-turn-helix transcriptional regulator [Rhizobiaceae bacterium LC148]
MDDCQAILMFGALSQITRLNVLRNLVIAGPEGLAAGRIAELAGVSSSNISFHLKEMEHAGLIRMRRESRSIIYSARYETLASLVEFLIRDCCSGHPAVCSAATSDKTAKA